MMEAQKEAIEKLLKTVTSAVGQTLNMMGILKFFIPVGFVAYAGYLFYKTFFVNPFKLSEKKLKEHIAEARIEEEKHSNQLKEIERLLKRIEAGEIKEDKSLLEIRKKQLEEAVKLAKTKVLITEMIIMVRENKEVFNKLFGKDNFKKLLDVDKFSERIDKELEKMGLKEKDKVKVINVEEFYEYFNKVFPMILANPEEYKAEVEKKEKEEEKEKAKILDTMLKEGSIDEWKEMIKKTIDSGERIKIPGRYENKEGYRNLIIALYILLEDVKSVKLKEVIEDKFLNRAIEYFKQLRTGTIEVAPESSDREYIDQLIEIMCGQASKEESTGTEIMKQFKLQLGEGEVFIERKTQKDPTTGRAQKVIYTIKR